MKIMGRLFGTDGVRIDLRDGIDPSFFSSLAQSICEAFGKGSIFLIGRDVRYAGDIIFHSMLSGLFLSGCRAFNAGLVTTPSLQYVIKEEGYFDGGIMITASHNPPNYNGVKVIDSDGIEVPRKKENEIEEIFASMLQRTRKTPIHEYHLADYPGTIEKYVNGVVSHVDDELIRSRELRVVIDAANSVGSLALPKIVGRLGGKVISLNAHLDPSFPGREPEPTPSTLAVSSTLTKEVGADMGVAVDGDADRSIFIDEKGYVYWGDRTAAIFSLYLKEKHPDLPARVYTGVSSSSFIEKVLKSAGIEVVWMKVGSVDISRRLKHEGGLLGFEENGGIMYPQHQFVRDAGMATALMMEILAREKRKLSELYSIFPRTYSIKTKYPIHSKEQGALIYERIKEKYSNEKIIDIDGIKVIGEDYWFLVRLSGTEPVIRVMIESEREGAEKNILREIEELLQAD